MTIRIANGWAHLFLSVAEHMFSPLPLRRRRKTLVCLKRQQVPAHTTKMIQRWYKDGANMIQRQYKEGTKTVPTRYKDGTDRIQRKDKEGTMTVQRPKMGKKDVIDGKTWLAQRCRWCKDVVGAKMWMMQHTDTRARGRRKRDGCAPDRAPCALQSSGTTRETAASFQSEADAAALACHFPRAQVRVAAASSY